MINEIKIGGDFKKNGLSLIKTLPTRSNVNGFFFRNNITPINHALFNQSEILYFLKTIINLNERKKIVHFGVGKIFVSPDSPRPDFQWKKLSKFLRLLQVRSLKHLNLISSGLAQKTKLWLGSILIWLVILFPLLKLPKTKEGKKERTILPPAVS